MPDDVTVGLNTVAADELLTVNDVPQVEPFPKAERVKPGWGADGVFNDVTPAAPLPVSDGAEGDAPPVLPTNARGVRGYLRAIYDHLTGETAVDLSPLGATADAVVGTLTDGRKTVTTAGTAVALRATLACKWVQVTALTSNTQQVNVGAAGVLAAAGSSTGTPLARPVDHDPVNDAAKVFVDARVAGEGVSFTVGA
jgi:hypothetical protein